MASKDVVPHSCQYCQKLLINFCGENMAEFESRHARIQAANPRPGPAPRPSTLTDGRMKVSQFKYYVSRLELIQWAADGCALCQFLVDECQIPDGCEDGDAKDLELWGEDLTGRSDSFDVEQIGFSWSKPSDKYPHLDSQSFTVYASQGT